MTLTATARYTIDAIRDEASHLVNAGTISRNQPIYTLCQYIPTREWTFVERELEQHSYLLRDRIIDLLGSEHWNND